MTRFALNYEAGPIAVRYPRGGQDALLPDSGKSEPIEVGRAETLRWGSDVLLVGLGAGVKIALDAADILAGQGAAATVLNARFCKPLDAETILGAARRCGSVVTIEDGTAKGGFGSAVLELLSEQGLTVPATVMGLPDHFIEHGPVPILRGLAGLTAEDAACKALALMPRRPHLANGVSEKLPAGVR